MINKVFCVFDSKVESYLKPFVMQARGEAIRAFTDLSNDETTNFCKHPGDYTLFELGEFNSDTAKFTLYDTPYSLGTCLEFKRISV